MYRPSNGFGRTRMGKGEGETHQDASKNKTWAVWPVLRRERSGTTRVGTAFGRCWPLDAEAPGWAFELLPTVLHFFRAGDCGLEGAASL